MRRRIVGTCVAGLLAALVGAPAAMGAPTGPVHPGVQTLTAGAQCTANFIFKAGTETYIGQAAHCSGTGAATETNGCNSASLPIGTPVTVTGASLPGTMVYNSWLAMQAVHEANADTCAYNDLALVRLDPADVGKVDPTVPGFGGPTGVGTAAVGGSVFSYGNSSLRLGVAQLSPKQGLVVQVAGNGWSRSVYTVTPGIPGDSGSGFMNASGQAIGILSTVAVLPLPLSNGVGDLGLELNYARSHGVPGVQLVNGTTPFSGNLVTAILGAGGGLLGRR
jgi:hypothetical protein